MKHFNYINIFLLAFVLVFSSCVDDSTLEDEIKGTPNLIGFVNSTAAVAAVASGEEFEKTVPVRMFGPNMDKISGAVTATVSVNENSTAIEGTHYRLDETTFTISEETNFVGEFPLIMLTDGIAAPLPENPTLILDVVNASGDGSVVASTQQIVVNMLYLCFADLSGTYSVTNDFCNTTFTAEISPNADGSWYLDVADGGFLHTCTSNTTLLNYGSINEVCGVVQTSDILRYGGLGIGVVLGGTWDQATGVLTMQHEDTFFNGGPYAWESTYTRQ